jgi:hypothetical protein
MKNTMYILGVLVRGIGLGILFQNWYSFQFHDIKVCFETVYLAFILIAICNIIKRPVDPASCSKSESEGLKK